MPGQPPSTSHLLLRDAPTVQVYSTCGFGCCCQMGTPCSRRTPSLVGFYCRRGASVPLRCDGMWSTSPMKHSTRSREGQRSCWRSKGKKTQSPFLWETWQILTAAMDIWSAESSGELTGLWRWMKLRGNASKTEILHDPPNRKRCHLSGTLFTVDLCLGR